MTDKSIDGQDSAACVMDNLDSPTELWAVWDPAGRVQFDATLIECCAFFAWRHTGGMDAFLTANPGWTYTRIGETS
jgi:hypothetical protein